MSICHLFLIALRKGLSLDWKLAIRLGCLAGKL